MNKKDDDDNIFKIDDKLIDRIALKILSFVKKEYKFFFGFFCGVIIIVLFT